MRTPGGMTLIELVLALALAALLVLGLLQIASAATSASRLQQNQAQVLDNARHAVGLLTRTVRQAGFSPEPWNGAFDVDALTGDTADGVTAGGDRLGLRAWSDRNCFDNRNPDEDAAGRPLFYLRESVFDLNGSQGLTHLCRYGPSPGELVTQVRRQGLVQGVEAFEVSYGEDADKDGNIERWVEAGAWSDPARVLGVRIGLLLASEDPVAEAVAGEFDVLGRSITSGPDGKLRRSFEITAALRGRTR